MNAKASRAFWACYRNLPQEIQRAADEKYALWQADPFHPSLHFKQIADDLWPIRINRNYRALARRKSDLIVWFWLGTHKEYERLIG